MGSKKQIYQIRVDSEINIEAQSHVSMQVFIPNTKIFTSFLKILKESPSSLDSYCIFGLKQFVKFSNHTKNQWRYWLTEYPSYFPL